MQTLASVGNARYRLHHVAYCHKTTDSLEHMLCDVLSLAGKHIGFRGDDGYGYVTKPDIPMYISSLVIDKTEKGRVLTVRSCPYLCITLEGRP